MFELLSGWLLGVLLGMRHALEADHLAAVSTLITDGQARFRGAFLGAIWGIGHTVALFGVGCVLALLKARMPDSLATVFELGVSVMLVYLGVRAVRRALRHVEGHVHVGSGVAARPLVVGLVHGLAGSGALTALVVAELPSVPARLAYIGLFGLGSVLGMALLSGLAGWPLAALGQSPRMLRGLSAVTGSVSVVLGIVWGYPLIGLLR
jgi:hypothetical protein